MGVSLMEKGKVVYFSASWCSICPKAIPMFLGVAQEFPEVVLEHVDADVNAPQVIQYNIKSLPTFLFLYNGVEVSRVVGGVGPDVIREYFKGLKNLTVSNIFENMSPEQMAEDINTVMTGVTNSPALTETVLRIQKYIKQQEAGSNWMAAALSDEGCPDDWGWIPSGEYEHPFQECGACLKQERHNENVKACIRKYSLKLGNEPK